MVFATLTYPDDSSTEGFMEALLIPMAAAVIFFGVMAYLAWRRIIRAAESALCYWF